MRQAFLCVMICFSFLLSCVEKDSELFSKKIFEGDLLISTQSGIDAFGESNYTHVVGKLLIGDQGGENSITNLDKLNSIREIDHLEIAYQENLVSIEGLVNLERAGFLIIHSNNKLLSLDGLEKLKRIEYIDSTVYGNLEGIGIENNFRLQSIKGLQNLEYVRGDFSISSNPKLTSLGLFENLETVTKALMISNLVNLMNIDGMLNLNAIGRLMIQENPLITNLDVLSELRSVGGVFIAGNDALIDFCGIKQALTNDNNNAKNSQYSVKRNLYNPSMEDIINGTCSQ